MQFVTKYFGKIWWKIFAGFLCPNNILIFVSPDKSIFASVHNIFHRPPPKIRLLHINMCVVVKIWFNIYECLSYNLSPSYAELSADSYFLGVLWICLYSFDINSSSTSSSVLFFVSGSMKNKTIIPTRDIPQNK